MKEKAAKRKQKLETEKKRVEEETKKNVTPVADVFIISDYAKSFNVFQNFSLLIIFLCCRLQPPFPNL